MKKLNFKNQLFDTEITKKDDYIKIIQTDKVAMTKNKVIIDKEVFNGMINIINDDNDNI